MSETRMPSLTVRVRDFRILESLDWSPQGVCVLSGANGTGKSTTLDAFRLLRALFAWGHESAFRAVDGVAFQRVGAASDAAVEFSIEVEDLVWKLQFPMSAHGVKGTYGEQLLRAGEVMLRAAMFEDGWYLGDERQPLDEQRCCAKVLWDRESPAWMQPLVDVLGGIRIHDTYWLNQVKRVEPVSATDSYLHATGRNLWSVLANWKNAPLRYRGQFEWVMAEARRAFPGLIGTIEFDRGLPYLFCPGATDPADGLLPNRAADGLLTGLLHLTAVAGAKNGSLIAFDEVENQLHPHAIRALISAMRKQADERDLTIVLTTHSPVVLNQFRDDPELVFVLGHGDPDLSVPASMADLHSEEWLAQAKLGSLYERLAFGAPPGLDGGDA
ncbi:AAA family ATPase [Haliangium sp.]|uniref:AAA family ATPase n=1 Tax=Haliangium sp. TaxID=2663208 RepID=UPI003D1185A7